MAQHSQCKFHGEGIPLVSPPYGIEWKIPSPFLDPPPPPLAPSPFPGPPLLCTASGWAISSHLSQRGSCGPPRSTSLGRRSPAEGQPKLVIIYCCIVIYVLNLCFANLHIGRALTVATDLV